MWCVVNATSELVITFYIRQTIANTILNRQARLDYLTELARTENLNMRKLQFELLEIQNYIFSLGTMDVDFYIVGATTFVFSIYFCTRSRPYCATYVAYLKKKKTRD